MSKKELKSKSKELATPSVTALQATDSAASLDAYISAAYNVPALSAEEELVLAKRYYNENDLQAAESLVRHNLRHVIYIARGYSGYGLSLADLIQEGTIGLMKAIKRYDPEHKVRLISFAVHAIRAEIHEFIIKNWRIVKVATTKAQRKLFFRLRSMKKTPANELNHSETQAIADELDVKYKDVVEMERRMGNADVSFYPDENDEDEKKSLAPANWMIEKGADPAESAEGSDWEAHRKQRLMDAIDSLDERSREIIMARRMADKKSTLKELAKKFNVSMERVRQIENNAMTSLRDALSDCQGLFV